VILCEAAASPLRPESPLLLLSPCKPQRQKGQPIQAEISSRSAMTTAAQAIIETHKISAANGNIDESHTAAAQNQGSVPSAHRRVSRARAAACPSSSTKRAKTDKKSDTQYGRDRTKGAVAVSTMENVAEWPPGSSPSSFAGRSASRSPSGSTVPRCPNCGAHFTTRQALGGHLRRLECLNDGYEAAGSSGQWTSHGETPARPSAEAIPANGTMHHRDDSDCLSKPHRSATRIDTAPSSAEIAGLAESASVSKATESPGRQSGAFKVLAESQQVHVAKAKAQATNEAVDMCRNDLDNTGASHLPSHTSKSQKDKSNATPRKLSVCELFMQHHNDSRSASPETEDNVVLL